MLGRNRCRTSRNRHPCPDYLARGPASISHYWSAVRVPTKMGGTALYTRTLLLLPSAHRNSLVLEDSTRPPHLPLITFQIVHI